MKKIILLLLVFAALFTGCASVKKQRSRAVEFYREFPEELAELCADKFAPEIKYTPGETIIKREIVTVPGDSIPCPEITNPETGQKSTPKVKCPDCSSFSEERVRVDTVRIPNKAREEQYRLQAERLSAELAVSTSDGERWRKQANFRLYILIAAAIGLGGYFLIKLRG